ncbi:MAG: TonB-dependent receptor, partial [Deltaproteobacteria bacterium]|nr:TonB-dependent receptor [Deltaproteobacteria bacterium]
DIAAMAEPPDVSLENVQVGARVSWRTDESDWSLSYYRGFDDFPVPVNSYPTVVPGTYCDGSEVTGLGGCVNTKVGLRYPAVHVFGFDLAGQIGFLDDAGFRLEGAIVWPEELAYTADIPDEFGPDIVGHSVDGRPFFKATLGFDYTFTRDIFGLLMFVHGMVDELGPQLVGDYLVAGMDFKFFNSKLLLRLFGIVALTAEEDDPSTPEDEDRRGGVIYPLLNWNPWSSMELEVGALILLGGEKSKFGQPAAGDSMAFLRSRVRF